MGLGQDELQTANDDIGPNDAVDTNDDDNNNYHHDAADADDADNDCNDATSRHFKEQIVSADKKGCYPVSYLMCAVPGCELKANTALASSSKKVSWADIYDSDDAVDEK